MNKNLKIMLTLGMIGIFSGLIISATYSITEPIIRENRLKREISAYQEIYETYSLEHSIIEEIDHKFVKKIITAKNSNQEILGKIYYVSGTNNYGNITMLIAINFQNEIADIRFIELNQSPGYREIVRDHTLESYIEESIDDLVVNVETGATYGSKLVETLIKEATKVHKGE